MARNLYRCYLYAVYLSLLVFATIGLGRLLLVLFNQPPLNGAAPGTIISSPTNAELVQALVFAGVSWAISGLLGGLHFWLIRRDIRHDPSAGTGAVRSFFLNFGLIVTVPACVLVASQAVLPELGHNVTWNNISGSLAFVLCTLILGAWLEWERQQFRPASGLPMVYQRLHIYLVQTVFLLFLALLWPDVSRQLIDFLFLGGAATREAGAPAICLGFQACSDARNTLSQLAALLWIGAFWLGYGFLSCSDLRSLFRWILHFGGLLTGFVFMIAGLKIAFELLFLLVAGHPAGLPQIFGPSASYNFGSPLIFGLLVIRIYWIWLRAVGCARILSSDLLRLTALAFLTALLAIAFWWGVGLTLVNASQFFFETGVGPSLSTWSNGVAFTAVGLVYIPLDLWFYRLSTRANIVVPRRGFVLVLLSGGILSGAVGASVALYTFGTAILGSPLADWQQNVRVGLIAFSIGLVLVLIYLWRVRRERLLAQVEKAADVDAPSSFVSLEHILDDLLAGRVSRDQAAAEIRRLTTVIPTWAGEGSPR